MTLEVAPSTRNIIKSHAALKETDLFQLRHPLVSRTPASPASVSDLTGTAGWPLLKRTRKTSDERLISKVSGSELLQQSGSSHATEDFDDDVYANYQLYGILNTKIVGCRYYDGRATVG